jgi:hypothetical protein
MNWKTVLHLVRVDMKSSRLMRGQRLIKYNVKRNKFFSYLSYVAAVVIGLAIGIVISLFYDAQATNTNFRSEFNTGFASFQLSLPTIILVFALIFTMMQQIQRSGARSTNQAPYWLPVTWQEHTLASVLADMMGLPIAAIALISPAVLIVSIFTGQVLYAVGAILAMVGAAFIAGATTEIFRILQLRFTGAVYKSTGKAAIWVRFISSITFFIIFYVFYFSITSGAGFVVFIQTIASVQTSAWFVPFLWLGMTLYSLINGLLLQGFAFLGLSLLFIVGLFYFATTLNSKFGLYEPPAITISRGAYTPKTGILGKFGFSSVEAALIRKDLKAFTRRRELISTFILPIVFLIIPIMGSLNNTAASSTSNGLPSLMFALTSIFPAALMAMSLGNFMTGEEGQNIWRIYAAPVSAKNFVKSKYAFMLTFSLVVLPITGTIGFLIYQPSTQTAITMILEAVFVAFAAGALSLANGIKGADFNELPRPRMIRAEWSLINMVTCAATALAIMIPLVPYVISTFFEGQIGIFLDLYPAVAISGIITAVLTVIFYKMAIGNAKELLTGAEA